MHLDLHAPPRPSFRTGLVAGLALAIAGIGGLAPSLAPHVLAQEASPAASASADGFFDSSFVHAISVTLDPDAYAAAIAAYQADETKEWLEVTATIDGVTYEQVGMRLKGNSSLRGLRGERGSSGTTSAATQSPETLPWLLRLDRSIDGQSIDGLTDIVVRSNSSETALNEALALELLSAAGLASQKAVASAFSVNGSDPVLRLVIEDPEDHWLARSFEGTGALYKAESTGDWSYRGDDPGSYDEVFDQEAGKDVTDLTPLIGFLQWINESDQATFSAGLAERFDVDAFATYLAMMDLLDNFDDIDGPGNNGYLQWDAASGVFTIVPWDMNLAFGAGPGGFGGDRQGGPGGEGRPMRVPTGPVGSFDPAMTPEGGQGGPGDVVRGGRGGGPGGQANPLVEKFRADGSFAALIETKKAELLGSLFGSGLARSILDTWTGVLQAGATSLVDAATIQNEASSLASRFPTS